MKVNSPSFLHSLTPVKNLTLQRQLLQFFSYFFLFLPNTLKSAIISLFFKVKTYSLFTMENGKSSVTSSFLPLLHTHTHTHTHTHSHFPSLLLVELHHGYWLHHMWFLHYCHLHILHI